MIALLLQAGRFLSALNDHWIGDLIGVVSLFALGWLLLVLGHGMGWQ